MRRMVFCVLMCLLLAFPAAAALAAEEKDDRPLTREELAEFQRETPKVEAELKAFVTGRIAIGNWTKNQFYPRCVHAFLW